MVTAPATEMNLDRIWQVLNEIQDPEIPVLSLVDLGIVRGVDPQGESVTVRLPPTFAGCPALHVMQQAVRDRLHGLGFADVKVETVLDPPWTTDDLSPTAREKLRGFGLGAPRRPAPEAGLRLEEPVARPHARQL